MASKAATEAASLVYPASPRLLRIYQIIGSQRKGIQPLIPVSRSCWLAGVKEGKFPPGIKLSPKVTVWHEASVLALINSAGA
jgi:predicted DNA-binding transcriptional regulator AlpA